MVGCCLFVIFSVPLSEGPQALTDSDFRRETVISLQCLGVRIGNRYIPCLHTYEFAMAFEVVIFWQHLCSHKLLLERTDIIQQILRLSSADVVHSIGWNRQAIFSILFSGAPRITLTMPSTISSI